MKTNVMAHVDEHGALRIYPLYHFQRFGERKMRYVPFLPQGIKHEQRNVAHLLEFAVVDVRAVGDIGKRPYLETQDGQPVVHHTDWSDLDACSRKTLIANFMHLEAGHTGIRMLNKAVR